MIHVFPEDGFAAEFSFPDTIMKPDKDWIRATYYRSYLDGDGQRVPCLGEDGELKKIPAGEYLLDLYVVGGDPKRLFKNKFSTKLFESVIFAGTIGPIPVTVWGWIGLGLDFLLEAYAYVKVAPFAPAVGGNYVESYFDLLSSVKISIPCEIRADILAGIASVATRLKPESTVNLIPYFLLKLPEMSAPQIDFFLQALFSLYFEVEACIQTLILGEECFGSGEIAIVKDAEIFSTHGSKPVRPASDCLGKGAFAEELAGVFGAGGGDGRGADTIVIEAYQVAVAPFTIVSPDRKTVVDAWVTEDAGTLLQLRVNEIPVKSAIVPHSSFYLIDPAGAFVSNDAAIIAWTSPAGELPLEDVPPRGSPEYLPAVNANVARAEVQVATLYRRPGFPPNLEWALFDANGVQRVNVMDVGDPSEGRADGRPSRNFGPLPGRSRLPGSTSSLRSPSLPRARRPTASGSTTRPRGT